MGIAALAASTEYATVYGSVQAGIEPLLSARHLHSSDVFDPCERIIRTGNQAYSWVDPWSVAGVVIGALGMVLTVSGVLHGPSRVDVLCCASCKARCAAASWPWRTRPKVEATASSASAGSVSVRVSSALTASSSTTPF